MRPLYLIDCSNYIYRFQTTCKRSKLINGVNFNMSAVYGFIRSLKSTPFKDIMICLDGIPEASIRYLPSYKGQRLKEPNESLSFSKSELIKFLTRVGEYMGKNIQVVCSPGQEADQVIASIAYQVAGLVNPMQIKMQNFMRNKDLNSDRVLQRYAKESELRELDLKCFDTVIISTTDSDMYQLLNIPNVLIDESTSGKMLNMGESTPVAVHHLHPNAIVAYKALVGDISDNVPPLDLPFKKMDEAIDFISKNFSNGEFNDFYLNLTGRRRQLTEDLDKLANYIINSNQVEALTVNHKVTKLEFVTTPLAIVYPTYSIKRTIEQYDLNSWIIKERKSL